MDKDISYDSLEIIKNLSDQNLKFSGKTVLLTGSLGFLGSQFCHYFKLLNDKGILAKPVKLIAMDNMIRGNPNWYKSFSQDDNITFINSDIVTQKEFPRSDYIIHAASIASPIYYRMHPINTMDVNVIGLRNILDWSKKSRPESILYFSTSEIYGDPDVNNIPTAETYRGNVSCIGPRACYDESKRYGETLCVNFWLQHKLKIKIARPFNNYGPGLKITDKRVLPDFFRNIIQSEDLIMYSDGKATRTFCYISDAITGYIQLLLSDYNGESFNIGTDNPEINMIDLASMVLEITSSKSKIKYKENQDKNYIIDNPNRRCPDLTKAKKYLNYKANINLDEGLRRTWKYYKNNPNADEL